jgi:hypothetical protein
MSKFFLIRRASFSEPKILNKTMLECMSTAVKRETVFLMLVLLSSGNFQSKKFFKESFNKVIKSPNDLYMFFHILRKHRGVGSVIHLAVKKWLVSHSVIDLEVMFVKERAKYNWAGRDILRMVKPKPRNKEENLLFRWITKGEIEKFHQLDYKNSLPIIYAYEALKREVSSVESFDYISQNNFCSDMIPSNVNRTELITNYIYRLKSLEEFLVYSKSRLNSAAIIRELERKLEDAEVDARTNLLELVSISKKVEENTNSHLSVTRLDEMIKHKFKKERSVKSDVVHFIDTGKEMLSEINKQYGLTPAVISSIMSSSSKERYSFSGEPIDSSNIRSVLEAEGYRHDYIDMNTNKILKIVQSNPKTIFIWTNRKDLREVEKTCIVLGLVCKESTICLINMRSAKVNCKDSRYFIIDGFNKNTRKLMRVVERGVI